MPLKVHTIRLSLKSGYIGVARFPYQSSELHREDLDAACDQFVNYLAATHPNDPVVVRQDDSVTTFGYKFTHEISSTGIQDMPYMILDI